MSYSIVFVQKPEIKTQNQSGKKRYYIRGLLAQMSGLSHSARTRLILYTELNLSENLWVPAVSNMYYTDSRHVEHSGPMPLTPKFVLMIKHWFCWPVILICCSTCVVIGWVWQRQKKELLQGLDELGGHCQAQVTLIRAVRVQRERVFFSCMSSTFCDK